MVARLEPVKSLSKPLLYNEEKVAQGTAKCIHASGFFKDKNNLTYEDKLRRFQRVTELNTRARVKMLHATLNFSPGDNLSNAQLSTIAQQYMQGLKMEKHPFLVYRHDDARHPHIHIVTTLIRQDGTRVNTHRMANRLSEPTRKSIEQEFHLNPGQQKKSRIPLPHDQLQKITSTSKEPVTESLNRILASVNKHYNFSNVHEYNAILRNYNITAELGSRGSKTWRHRGVYYLALNDQGYRTSPPVMASQLPCRPTFSRLQEKFHHPDKDHLNHLTSIRQRIDWIIDQQRLTSRDLVSGLKASGIEIVFPPSNGRCPHDHVFVDFQTLTAVTGQTLGRKYSETEFFKTQDRATRQGKKINRKKHSLPDFCANVPQLLSSIMRIQPGDQDPIYYGLGHKAGNRFKR